MCIILSTTFVSHLFSWCMTVWRLESPLHKVTGMTLSVGLCQAPNLNPTYSWARRTNNVYPSLSLLNRGRATSRVELQGRGLFWPLLQILLQIRRALEENGHFSKIFFSTLNRMGDRVGVSFGNSPSSSSLSMSVNREAQNVPSTTYRKWSGFLPMTLTSPSWFQWRALAVTWSSSVVQSSSTGPSPLTSLISKSMIDECFVESKANWECSSHRPYRSKQVGSAVRVTGSLSTHALSLSFSHRSKLRGSSFAILCIRGQHGRCQVPLAKVSGWSSGSGVVVGGGKEHLRQHWHRSLVAFLCMLCGS